MGKISSDVIKKLRELTGAGFLDCKEALDNTNNDIDQAIEHLRKKGITTAQKKGDRTANEGLISISISDSNKEASIIEVNSETDFVARNDDFQTFVSNISKIHIKEKCNLEDLMEKSYIETSDKISETLTNLISKIGENLEIRRCDFLSIDDGYVGTYVHNVEKDTMGKIGVLVSVQTKIEYNNISDFLKKISMHIAATDPVAITESDIDKNLLDKEKSFQLEEIKKSGKDPSIQEKMLEGKMKKYFNEVVLLEQNLVMDDSLKIKDYIENFSKEYNNPLEIKKFIRFKVGEGIK